MRGQYSDWWIDKIDHNKLMANEWLIHRTVRSGEQSRGLRNSNGLARGFTGTQVCLHRHRSFTKCSTSDGLCPILRIQHAVKLAHKSPVDCRMTATIIAGSSEEFVRIPWHDLHSSQIGSSRKTCFLQRFSSPLSVCSMLLTIHLWCHFHSDIKTLFRHSIAKTKQSRHVVLTTGMFLIVYRAH